MSKIKLSVCNEMFEGWDVVEVFRYAAELGYEGVEIASFTLADSVAEIAPERRRAIRRAAEALRMVEEIAHPNFRTMVDVRSACFGERETVAEVVRRVKDHLGHFHANDANGLGPGFGDVDYAPIAKALKAIGYEGYVSVEVFDFAPGPKKIASESLDYLRKFF